MTLPTTIAVAVPVAAKLLSPEVCPTFDATALPFRTFATRTIVEKFWTAVPFEQSMRLPKSVAGPSALTP
jgi:hypothetical protein